MTNLPAIATTAMPIQGKQRAEVDFLVPAHAEAFVFAVESAADAILEVRASDAPKALRADNPVERTGTQRIALRTSAAQRLTVAVIGKEHAAVRGRVTVRVVVAGAEEPSCKEAQRALALADAEYAAGLLVTHGERAGASAEAAYSAAFGHYQKAAEVLGKSAGRLLPEALHAAAAVLYEGLNAWPAAASWAQRAEAAYAAAGDDYGRARAQMIHAEALVGASLSTAATAPSDKNASLEDARSILTGLVSFHGARGEFPEQAQALNDIGMIDYFAGRAEEALKEFRKAVVAYERTTDPFGLAITLQNIALAEYEKGRLAEAIAGYERALALARDEDSARTRIFIMNNIALANWQSGKMDSAFRYYSEALELGRARQEDITEQSRSLHGIGDVYSSIGELTLALSFYREALGLRAAELDRRRRIATLRAIAGVLRRQGKVTEAARMNREALSLATDPVTSARVQVQLANDIASLGQIHEALQMIENVLRQVDSGESGDVLRAWALLERGRIRAKQGAVSAAESDFEAALRICSSYEISEELEAWVELAQLRRRRGAAASALAAVDAALLLGEEVRLQSANPEMRAMLMQRVRPAFDLKISMLVEQHFAARDAARSDSGQSALGALMVAEQARARALADFQRLDLAGGSNARDVTRRRELYAELASLRLQLSAALERVPSSTSPVDALQRQIAATRVQVDQINSRVGTSGSAGDTRSSGIEAIPHERIPRDTAVVEFWIGSEEAFAWVATRDRLDVVRLASPEQIDEAARALHAALRDVGVTTPLERRRHGARLYALIIAPIETLVSGRRSLIFVPDGVLHYVPFAALPKPSTRELHYLVETHDVAVAPSLGMLLRDDAQVSRPPRRALVIADPVYGAGDARVKAPPRAVRARLPSRTPQSFLFRGGAPGFSRLPGTAVEAAAIADLLPGSIDRLEGFNATRAKFLEADLARYRFVHIGSHGVVDSEIPQLSALVLSTVDGRGRPIESRVMAADFMTMQINADVVVLSACETALGRNVPGEGLVGLQYVVIARGARTVLSSLWQVPDHATSRLMSGFYANLLRHDQSVIAAASDAMRAMIRSELSDPSFWSAFSVTVSRGDRRRVTPETSSEVVRRGSGSQ